MEKKVHPNVTISVFQATSFNSKQDESISGQFDAIEAGKYREIQKIDSDSEATNSSKPRHIRFHFEKAEPEENLTTKFLRKTKEMEYFAEKLAAIEPLKNTKHFSFRPSRQRTLQNV